MVNFTLGSKHGATWSEIRHCELRSASTSLHFLSFFLLPNVASMTLASSLQYSIVFTTIFNWYHCTKYASKAHNFSSSVQAEFAWASRESVLTQNALKASTSLSHVRIAFCIHLDVKNAVCLRGLLDRGCKMFITTCNPATVRNEVVANLKQHGAEIIAWKDMAEKVRFLI